jgi:polyisoprenoid-binding protein YceI
MNAKQAVSTLAAAAVLALAAAGAAPLHAAQVYKIDPVHSEVSFQVRHLVSTVTGKFEKFQGTVVMDPKDPAASKVDFQIDTSSIDTGVDKRDNHLRSQDFFYVEKYPEITFESEKVAATGKGAYDVTGTLTMRGVAKQVTLPVKFLGTAADPWGNTRAGFSTSTTLDRQDYGINWNQALDQGGFLLGDDVTVSISLEAVQQKDAGQAPAK